MPKIDAFNSLYVVLLKGERTENVALGAPGQGTEFGTRTSEGFLGHTFGTSQLLFIPGTNRVSLAEAELSCGQGFFSFPTWIASLQGKR